MSPQKYRSFLCGSPLDEKLVARASAVKADFVHFDLASSVPQFQKESARHALSMYFGSDCGMPFAIRINSLESQNGQKDLLSLAGSGILPDVCILPKVTMVSEVDTVAIALSENSGRPKIFAVIENQQFLHHLGNLSEAPENLDGIIFGAVDYCADAGLPISHSATRPARFEIAQIANNFGIAAIDTPCFPDDDGDEVKRQSDEAKTLGYAGKIALIPSHVPIINECFSSD